MSLARTARITDRPFAGLHVMMVVAHPDDEILGAGGQFADLAKLSLVHLTDGAPSARAARWHGFADRVSYRAARERELADALQATALQPDRFGLGLPDQQASFHLVTATLWLAALLDQVRPDLVLTHPYEGGHPDHDATAFIVAAALCRHRHDIPHWEFTAYHRQDGAMATGRFLPRPDLPIVTVRLDAVAQADKRRARDCFVTQQEILSQFPLDAERFRLAPSYDFTQPPHPGRLLYESRRRAWTGAHWRRRARAASRRLSASRPLYRWPGRTWHHRLRETIWRAWLAI